jgi:hypothetical protein
MSTFPDRASFSPSEAGVAEQTAAELTRLIKILEPKKYNDLTTADLRILLPGDEQLTEEQVIAGVWKLIEGNQQKSMEAVHKLQALPDIGDFDWASELTSAWLSSAKTAREFLTRDRNCNEAALVVLGTFLMILHYSEGFLSEEVR